MNKNTFCSLPFSAIFLGSNGGVRPCCSMDRDLGNINDSSIEEILNGKDAISVKSAMINGEWHTNCSQCKKLEERGNNTQRTHSLLEYETYKNYQATDFTLKKLDLRWSNTCNLTCTYCSSYFSSNWAKINGIQVNANKAVAEDSIFRFIKHNSDTIEEVILLGGEPLLQKPNHKLIDIIPSSHYYILTNLSVKLTENVLAVKLLASTNVAWGISFETIGERFEYVRHGASWLTFVENLRYLFSQTGNRCSISAQPVYCLYSAFNLCEFYNFIDTEGYFSNVYWQQLTNISNLDVFKLPIALKLKAITELNKCCDMYENKYDLTILKNIRSHLLADINNQPIQQETGQLAWINSSELTLKKTTKFLKLWPEVAAELLASYSIKINLS